MVAYAVVARWLALKGDSSDGECVIRLRRLRRIRRSEAEKAVAALRGLMVEIASRASVVSVCVRAGECVR